METIKITVNGSTREFVKAGTVADLVEMWHPTGRGIAVALNRAVIPRSEWSTTPIPPASEVEIVSAVAGG